jgi:hypothetical protein
MHADRPVRQNSPALHMNITCVDTQLIVAVSSPILFWCHAMQRRAASTTGLVFFYFAAAVSLRIYAAVYTPLQSSRENYDVVSLRRSAVWGGSNQERSRKR